MIEQKATYRAHIIIIPSVTIEQNDKKSVAVIEEHPLYCTVLYCTVLFVSLRKVEARFVFLSILTKNASGRTKSPRRAFVLFVVGPKPKKCVIDDARDSRATRRCRLHPGTYGKTLKTG